MRTLAQRNLRLLATGLAATLVVAVAAFLLLEEGEEQPRGPVPLTEPVDDGFVHRALAPNETPDADHGIVFVDIATGQGELWTVPGAVNPEYVVDEGHRWLLMVTPLGREVIADRATGTSYGLNVADGDCWRMLASSGPPPWLLGPTPDGLLVVQSQCEPGLFAVVDLEDDPTGIAREFSLPNDAGVTSPPMSYTAVALEDDLLAVVSRVRHSPPPLSRPARAARRNARRATSATCTSTTRSWPSTSRSA